LKQFENKVHLEGRIFSHTLQKRVTGEQSKNPGTEYIGGTLNIATDEAGINVVPVRFTYVTAVYSKSGKPNDTYNVLSQIIENDVTWEKNGKEAAPQVRIDGDIEVNDFLGRNGEMVEAKGVRGSFVHFANGSFGLNSDENKRNTFEADMLITATIPQEPEGGESYLNLRGYVFAYRNALVPVTFSIHIPAGITYFEKCDISNNNPLLTKVWGNIVSTTQEIKTEVESAFGGSQVNVTTRTLRAWDVIGCAVEPYEWNDEATITAAEFQNLLADREQVKAEAKRRAEERNNSASGSAGFPSSGNEAPKNSSPTAAMNFKF
jgi:hypothetical protein